jgi:hypothetical protein
VTADRQESESVHSVSSIATFGLIENGLSLVVFGSIAFSLVMSLLFLLTRGAGRDSAYDHIGAGGISREGEYAGEDGYAGTPATPASESPAAQAEREREIRQMLGARSERLVRSGQPALDIDAEIARLLGAERSARTRDAGLVAEVRQLVVARNERRLRQGMQPLDIDAEMARTLDELEP